MSGSFKGNREGADEMRICTELAKHHYSLPINGFKEDPTEGKSEKFWIMRRQSFNLLRSKVKDKHYRSLTIL